ncbi:MAG TPA: DUF72 domain-containing protein [Candidatus Dormibacteraeota bacterium]|jgi:uncharacterized protein YecE (DUF72 family)|nr:DUF72 domain-containing protein [Candidatus Dormibacteraeota bacterium]
MRHKVYAGASGWAYSTWKPEFYPADVSSKNFLAHYSSRINSVEVNYTFRTLPSEKLLTGWMSSVSPDFVFSIKANEQITHRKRLRDAAAFTKEFLGLLQPLREANRLGCVLFQLPPFVKCDVKLLGDFLAALGKAGRLAFEFRHDSWFNDEVYAALSRANAALCIAEGEDLDTPQVKTADFSYLRLRKEKYTPKERKLIAQRVSKLAAEGDVYAYFKHVDEPWGPLAAEELLKTQK